VDEYDWDMIRLSEARCCRVKRASAIVLRPKLWVGEASIAELDRFESPLREARTSCEGLLDGQRFERSAGKMEAE